MKVKTVPRRWGNSLAVIIPKKIVEAQKINETEEVVITIEKPKPKAGVLFGFLKDWKKPTQEIKDEIRKGWESASDRKRWK